MITGTLVMADMAISFTLPDVMSERGTVTVCEMSNGVTRTTKCTHAQLGAALALATGVALKPFNHDMVMALYTLAEPIQPQPGESMASRWIP